MEDDYNNSVRWLLHDIDDPNDRRAISFDILKILKQALALKILTGLPTILSSPHRLLLDAGLGRTDGLAKGMTIGDPASLLAAKALFQSDFNSNFSTLLDDQVKDLLSMGLPPPSCREWFWEHEVPLILLPLFHNTKLFRTLFATYTSDVEQMVNDQSHIVGLGNIYNWNNDQGISLQTFMNAHYWNNSCLSTGQTVGPFYYFRSSSLTTTKKEGPDLVFVIQIGEQKYPVFVRFILFKQLDGQQAIDKVFRSVHHSTSELIGDSLPDLAKYCFAGGQYISLIVSYPSNITTPLSSSPWLQRSLGGLTQNLIVINRYNAQHILTTTQMSLLDSVAPMKRSRDMDSAVAEEDVRISRNDSRCGHRIMDKKQRAR
ncbi:hypothetical protein BX616_005913 [Lobosporangium transversale]|uniref:Uncharacterized protein n=1 Tax=Lobosporangium transversale TaxID=64571 RepID=A0A1Y2GFA8_9FUNG|nr:hypothetical protein BCR41DRAFT_359697 [Lobosporangium transversale]KAF9897258.1 hypothetical protein BX616_005913 [Lobosporangium transversale]ORZ07955.1 hypothetical protein BCR41DRAFT_359697 [Lobosporangium transversale]|eukprot:XP_021878189.1 hypothetical protein BCR41DRAFT_359697 [Lobosporangium transversale]